MVFHRMPNQRRAAGSDTADMGNQERVRTVTAGISAHGDRALLRAAHHRRRPHLPPCLVPGRLLPKVVAIAVEPTML